MKKIFLIIAILFISMINNVSALTLKGHEFYLPPGYKEGYNQDGSASTYNENTESFLYFYCTEKKYSVGVEKFEEMTKEYLKNFDEFFKSQEITFDYESAKDGTTIYKTLVTKTDKNDNVFFERSQTYTKGTDMCKIVYVTKTKEMINNVEVNKTFGTEIKENVKNQTDKTKVDKKDNNVKNYFKNGLKYLPIGFGVVVLVFGVIYLVSRKKELSKNKK